MSDLRVCVDATPLLLRSAGVKTYVWHWTEALRRTAGARRVTRFPFLDRPGRPLDHRGSMLPPIPTWLRLAVVHSANLTGGATAAWVGRRADVFHASHQFHAPPRITRLTATLYDMTCWLMPEMHRRTNVRGAKAFTERVARRADALFAISRNTRDDAVRLLGLDPDRIHVVYPGVADAYFEAPPAPSTRPYALFVGTIEPRKNVAAILDAWERTPGEFDLVIAGSAGWGEDAVLGRLSAKPPRVRYLGYVPEEDLPGLMRGATIFIYPSLYEGFGLPVAQALAAGVPVVTSNVSSLPEVAGPGGLLVDPRSPAEIASAVCRLLESEKLRSELAAAGRARAGEFRWDHCARLSWAVFERVAGKIVG
jgi:glycosyltransferase involved in cell wall biosynthesis